MISTTTYERGHVIVVNVPFSDASGTKPRPALVVSGTAFHADLPDVIVCPISSRPRFYKEPGSGDHPLHKWEAVGLRYPSTVRVSKLLAIDKRIVRRVLGRLHEQDLTSVDRLLRLALNL